MGTTRLQIYNQALRICGERRLASLTEDRKPRHLLDQVWAEGGVDKCLEQGQWNFAMRAVQIDSDPAVSPNFGLAYGFTKPSDWIRTAGFCSDERFETPFLGYKDETGYWYADITPIYVRYVSNDAGFGGDLSMWPGTFSDFVGAYFAKEVVFDLTSDKERVLLVEKELKKSKLDALNKDAMNDPTTFPSKSSWVNARGMQGWRRDGGNRGSLIG